MNLKLSILCNRGEHGKCSGSPPSPEMARFLPPEMREARCQCSCHDHAASPSYPDGPKGKRAYICRYCGEPIHATSRTLTSFKHGKRPNDRDFKN